MIFELRELMNTGSWIVVLILVVANVILVVSECIKRKSIAKEINALRQKREEEMYDRAGAESLATVNDDDLKDEIEPKQIHTWIMGIVVCLNVWILGAAGSHWWATTYFVDNSKQNTYIASSPNDDPSTVLSEQQNTMNVRGLFGDSFGAVNALVSALAFGGMIVAFVLQRYELRLQRKELRDSRAEMRRQTLQFKSQNQILKVQRFENTFFQMLNQFQEITNNITYSYKDKDNVMHTVRGREAFYFSFEVAIHESNMMDWNPLHFNHQYVGMRDIIKTFGYDGYMESFSPTYFDHYFRFLYRILKFVNTTSLLKGFDEEYEYTCMLRAMLSRYELVWLYYNGLAYGKDKLKPLIERYAMLNNLREELLAGTLNEFGVYESSAWKLA